MDVFFMSKKEVNDEGNFKVMMNEDKCSACIYSKKDGKVYMLGFGDDIAELNDYVVGLNEVVDLLNDYENQLSKKRWGFL